MDDGHSINRPRIKWRRQPDVWSRKRPVGFRGTQSVFQVHVGHHQLSLGVNDPRSHLVLYPHPRTSLNHPDLQD